MTMSENLNTTINGPQPSSCTRNPTAEKIGQTVASCLIFLVSLAGNTFIGIIVYKTKTMRKPINFFIVNMAMSDLLLPIFLIPSQIQMIYIDSWLIGGPLGQVLCKLVHFFQETSFMVSIQSLVLIAVDRFGAVVFPLRPSLISSKLCPIFILATWMVAMAVTSPHLFAFKVVEHHGEQPGCELMWNEAFGEHSSFAHYTLAMVVVFLYTPLLLIAILYIIIYLTLKSQKVPGEQSNNFQQQRAKRERTVLKMAIATVVTFAVCVLPLSVDIAIIEWGLFESLTESCAFEYFTFISSLMALSNCAINPYICFIFSGNYRQGLRNLFR